MIALLDIGNSRVKWGWLEGAALHTGRPCATSGDIEQHLSMEWTTPPRRVLVSNVAGPTLQQRLDAWLQTRYGVCAEFVRALPQAYGVTNGYREPRRLGCDRWLALLALRHGWQGAVCVLDVGTAATFDLLDGNGLHRGGAIVPGLNLMARALVDNTVAITSTVLSEADWLGHATDQAIHCGALNALAGMAERLRRQACRELNQPVSAILTGGDALLLASCLPEDWQMAPDLVLQGLAVVAREAA
ncbi:MAG: type III pantothenate kinase [Methylococcaceae bacterium]|nr:MAG: type III pantothenate kinase [Methylococcaceae bacterium]